VDAIVLVGGQGTRLRPLTDRRHKSLVPVCNRPAIEYLFDWLRRSGMKRVVLALGQNNEDLARAYPEGSLDDIKLMIIEERSRLESGGAIRNAVEIAGIEGTFAVLNGDVFVDFSFEDALEAHRAKGADLTIALAPVDDPWHFGVAAVDEHGLITGFVEKPPRGEEPGNLVNAGVWIFEPQIVAEIPPGAVRVEETLFPSLVGRGRPVLGYEFEGPWADIGTPSRYLELNHLLLDARAASVRGEGCRIANSATVTRSALGDAVTVGDAATISGSVLWENVVVEGGVRLTNCVVADGVSVGKGSVLEDVVVGSGASIAPGTNVRERSIESGARYDESHER
jgi:mannose-1-phosphate guanylyltransferase